MLTAFLVGLGVGVLIGGTLMAMIQVFARADRDAAEAFRHTPRRTW